MYETVLEITSKLVPEWDGEPETLTACAEQAVEIEEAHGLSMYRDYYHVCEQALIAWSQEIALRSARDRNRPQEIIDQIIMIHEKAAHFIKIKEGLIDIALKLDARTIPAE